MTQENAITKIGVLSDTHFPESGEFPQQVLEAMKEMDVIIHLGDFCNLETYLELQQIAPVIAVHGNCESAELRTQLPEKKKIEINGKTFGLVHGWGPRKNLEKRVTKVFDDVDVILFGHSHVPIWTEVEGQTVFNPGSLFLNDDVGTYGILEIGDSISHHIVEVNPEE